MDCFVWIGLSRSSGWFVSLVCFSWSSASWIPLGSLEVPSTHAIVSAAVPVLHLSPPPVSQPSRLTPDPPNRTSRIHCSEGKEFAMPWLYAVLAPCHNAVDQRGDVTLTTGQFAIGNPRASNWCPKIGSSWNSSSLPFHSNAQRTQGVLLIWPNFLMSLTSLLFLDPLICLLKRPTTQE